MVDGARLEVWNEAQVLYGTNDGENAVNLDLSCKCAVGRGRDGCPLLIISTLRVVFFEMVSNAYLVLTWRGFR